VLTARIKAGAALPEGLEPRPNPCRFEPGSDRPLGELAAGDSELFVADSDRSARRSDERVFGGKNLPTLSVVLHNS
jgi:hypothetical protein